MADITDEEIKKRFRDKMKKDIGVVTGGKPSKKVLVSDAPGGKIFEFNSPKLKDMKPKYNPFKSTVDDDMMSMFKKKMEENLSKHNSGTDKLASKLTQLMEHDKAMKAARLKGLTRAALMTTGLTAGIGGITLGVQSIFGDRKK